MLWSWIAWPDTRGQCSPSIVPKSTAAIYADRTAFLDWLRVEYAIEKPSLKLQDVPALDADGLVAEVRKVRGNKQPLTVAGLKALKEEHTRTVAPLQGLAAEARDLEWRVSELVNQAYGLTAEEVALMWKTAPPRMPVGAGK